MQKRIKCKNIANNLTWKYLVDKDTWEIEEIKFSNSHSFISIKNKSFMRVFDNRELKKRIYERLWDYTKYILLISDYTDYWNTINFPLFQKDYDITDPLLSKIRKRLEDSNIIVKNDKVWYLNPIIAYKGTEVSVELWDMFKDKTLEIYWIKSL